jgi:hypothetical protein
MGSGRTGQQESGGYGDSSYDDSSNTGNKDSTTGKLMEKAGGMFGSKSMEEKGRAKREQAGGYGDDNTGNY